MHVIGKSYMWTFMQHLKLVIVAYEEVSDSFLFFVRLAMQLS